jgi:hypothetical protein
VVLVGMETMNYDFFCFFVGYRMNLETKNYGIEVT